MKKTKIIFRIFLSVVLALTSSCAVRQVRETQTISFDNVDTSKLQQKSQNDLQYSEFIYSVTKWPLEDFISGLMSGQFNDAIKSLDITYRPSNVDNEAMLSLVRNGFVPVFIKIKNTGDTSAELNLSNFILHDGNEKLTPLNRQDLPNRSTHFSARNAIENAADITGVIVFAALIVAVLAAAGPGNYNLGDGGTNSKWFGTGDSAASSDSSLKSTTVITSINYGNALLTSTTLKPGETAQGLLFFQTKNRKPPVKPKLELLL